MLSPITVAKVETGASYFSHFIIECAEDSAFTTNKVEKRGEGAWDSSSSVWKLLPITFHHTVKGTTYYFRIKVVDTWGGESGWGPSSPGYVTEVAGDSTGPSEVLTSDVSAVAFGDITECIVSPSTYTEDDDHDHYRWWKNTSDTFPGGDPEYSGGRAWSFTGSAGNTYYIFVAAVDTSGNLSANYSSRSVASITISKLTSGEMGDIGLMDWSSSDMNFQASDQTTVNWDAGTIRFSDGTSLAVSSGNTGSMASITYIYSDNSSTLKTSTTYTDAVGENKILVGVAEPNSVSGKKANYQVFGGCGGGLRTLTADHINVDTLAAITANLGEVVMDAEGHLRGGKSSYSDTTAGFWLGYDTDSKYKFHIGNASNSLTWDGSNLDVIGTVQSSDGTDRIVLNSAADRIDFYESGSISTSITSYGSNTIAFMYGATFADLYFDTAQSSYSAQTGYKYWYLDRTNGFVLAKEWDASGNTEYIQLDYDQKITFHSDDTVLGYTCELYYNKTNGEFIISSGDLVSGTHNYNDLGSDSVHWNSVYMDGLVKSVSALTIQTETGDITLNPAGNDVLPSADNTHNFGSLSYKWKEINTVDLVASEDIYFSGVLKNTDTTTVGRFFVEQGYNNEHPEIKMYMPSETTTPYLYVRDGYYDPVEGYTYSPYLKLEYSGNYTEYASSGITMSDGSKSAIFDNNGVSYLIGDGDTCNATIINVEAEGDLATGAIIALGASIREDGGSTSSGTKYGLRSVVDVRQASSSYDVYGGYFRANTSGTGTAWALYCDLGDVKIENTLELGTGSTGGVITSESNNITIDPYAGAVVCGGHENDDLGTDSLHWKSLYLKDTVKSSAALTIQTETGDITLTPAGNNVLPGADSTHDFGSSTVRWKTGYFDDIDVANGVDLGTTITVNQINTQTGEDLTLNPDGGSVIPGASTQDLGSDVNHWDDLYINGLIKSAAELTLQTEAGDILFNPAGGDVTPYSDGGANLGSSSKGWGTLYLNDDAYIQDRIIGGFGAMVTSGTLDWNDTSNCTSGSGYTLLTGNATNGPGPTDYFHPFNFEYGAGKDGANNITQFAIPYSNANSIDEGIYFRGRYSGTWTGWVKVLSENTSGNIPVGSPFVPGTTGTIDIGTDSYHFQSLYIKDKVKASTALDIQTEAGDITLTPAGNNVLPGADSTHDFGSSTVRWKTGYFDDIDADTVTVTNSLDVSGNSTTAIFYDATVNNSIISSYSAQTDYKYWYLDRTNGFVVAKEWDTLGNTEYIQLDYDQKITFHSDDTVLGYTCELYYNKTNGEFIISSGDLVSGTHNYNDLGSDSVHWNSVYMDGLIKSAGALTIQTEAGDITLNPAGNDVLPDTNEGVNLGSSSLKFGYIYGTSVNTDSVSVSSEADIDGDIYNDDIVKPSIATSGTADNRVIQVDVDDIAGSVSGRVSSSVRGAIHYWFSTSSFGDPSFPTSDAPFTFTVNNGNNITPSNVDNEGVNYAVCDSNGIFKITIGTLNVAVEGTVYLHCEIQGIVYSTSFTVYTQV